MLTGFYREPYRKGVDISVYRKQCSNVSKTAYTNRNNKLVIKYGWRKGRRLLSQKASDTLAVKVVGGPNLGGHFGCREEQGSVTRF